MKKTRTLPRMHFQFQTLEYKKKVCLRRGNHDFAALDIAANTLLELIVTDKKQIVLINWYHSTIRWNLTTFRTTRPGQVCALAIHWLP